MTTVKTGVGLVLALVLTTASGTSAGVGDDLRLVSAVKSGRTDTIRALLTHGADVNAAEPDGMTALLWAAHLDNVAVLEQLIGAGANVNVSTRYGVTALGEAARLGNVAMVRALLKAGATPNVAVLGDGETPLMRAAQSGQEEAVRLLLDSGARVNAREALRGTTALMYAAVDDHVAVAKLLIERGAEVNARSTAWDNEHQDTRGGSSTYIYTNGGLTALHLAARENALKTGAALLGAGADINAKDPDWGYTPSLIAAYNGNFDFVRLLAEHGAALDGVLYLLVDLRHWESTKVSLPSSVGAIPLMRWLLARGVDSNTPFMLRVAAREALYPAPPPVAPPLFRAAQTLDREAMDALLEAGADANRGRAEDGMTPLMVVEAAGVRGRRRTLDEGPPPPTAAQITDAMKSLLQHGANPNQRNKAGYTVAHLAADNGDEAVVKWLGANGADLTIVNPAGDTPLDLLSESKNARPRSRAR